MPARLLLLLVAVVAAGCGDKEAASVDRSPPMTATAEPSPSTDAAAPAAVAVSIKGFTYSPARVTVRRGGRVTWDNKDASNHTVTFTGAKGPDDLGNLRAAKKGTVTFPGRGSFAYVCEFHPGMAGTVEVR